MKVHLGLVNKKERGGQKERKRGRGEDRSELERTTHTQNQINCQEHCLKQIPQTTPTKQVGVSPLPKYIGGLSGLALSAFWGRESDAIESRWNANLALNAAHTTPPWRLTCSLALSLLPLPLPPLPHDHAPTHPAVCAFLSLMCISQSPRGWPCGGRAVGMHWFPFCPRSLCSTPQSKGRCYG